MNLPNELTRSLGLWVGKVIQIEWQAESQVILLRPLCELFPLSEIPKEEQGKTAYLTQEYPPNRYDNSEPLS